MNQGMIYPGIFLIARNRSFLFYISGKRKTREEFNFRAFFLLVDFGIVLSILRMS
jgi:hypothetical protein